MLVTFSYVLTCAAGVLIAFVLTVAAQVYSRVSEHLQKFALHDIEPPLYLVSEREQKREVKQKWIQKPSYLVIGGSGFLGRRVVNNLLKRKLHVRISVFDTCNAFANNPDVEFIKGSISDLISC